jgi:hypothetical protein
MTVWAVTSHVSGRDFGVLFGALFNTFRKTLENKLTKKTEFPSTIQLRLGIPFEAMA